MNKSDRLQMDIQAQNALIAQRQKEMLNFVAPKTVHVPGKSGIEEQIPISKHPLASRMYVIHKVQPNDTLDRLCILYDVSKDMIRKANQFTGDEIFMKREIIIPHSAGPIFRPGETVPYSEEQRKKDSIEIMAQHLKERFGGQPTFKAEAQYYLEITGYDLKKAIEEFEQDLKFEKEQEQKFKGLKKSKKNQMEPLLYLKK